MRTEEETLAVKKLPYRNIHGSGEIVLLAIHCTDLDEVCHIVRKILNLPTIGSRLFIYASKIFAKIVEYCKNLLNLNIQFTTVAQQ